MLDLASTRDRRRVPARRVLVHLPASTASDDRAAESIRARDLARRLRYLCYALFRGEKL